MDFLPPRLIDAPILFLYGDLSFEKRTSRLMRNIHSLAFSDKRSSSLIEYSFSNVSIKSSKSLRADSYEDRCSSNQDLLLCFVRSFKNLIVEACNIPTRIKKVIRIASGLHQYQIA